MLPIEAVHIICLFTGKFIFDKNGVFKSVVDLRDFENIKKHLNIFKYFHNHRRISLVNNIFIKYLHRDIYKRPVMDKEERMKEEIIHYKNVDFERHSLLFLKERQINDVIVPLENRVFCNKCSTQFISLEMQLRQYFVNIGYKYDDYSDIVWNLNRRSHNQSLFCKNCYKHIYAVSLLPEKDIEKEQKRPKMGKVYNYMKDNDFKKQKNNRNWRKRCFTA